MVHVGENMKLFNDYTVLTTHTAAAPLVGTFQIDKGVITEAGIFFPPGCHGLVYAKVFFQEHQILPRNQESWCHGNNGWWRGKLYFPVTAAPLNIKVVAYALDTSFPHTITAALEISPFSSQPLWRELLASLRRIGEMLGVGD